jgi:uncharacterized repeat protein (TIGR03803 family)
MKRKLLIGFVVFYVTASAQYSKLIDFAGVTNGSSPQIDQNLIFDGTFLYGMTEKGGPTDKGIIFKIKPDGTGYLKIHDFGSIAADGFYPYGSLIFDGTFLYGMSFDGGAYGYGTIFKIKPDGAGYSKLLDFAYTDGGHSYGSLISDGTFLYGMTWCGSFGEGIIFKIKPDGNGYYKLMDFTGAPEGSSPYGSLIYDGAFLYGMTTHGGTSGFGIIFKIKSDGTGYSKLLDFDGATNGKYPYGSLVSDGVFLYGMTEIGGTNNKGTIFKIKPDGTGYSKLLDFAGTANGQNPKGSLICDGTLLYGITSVAIFKIKTDGSGYSNLFGIVGNNQNGILPYGSLLSYDNFLYGMTYAGGVNNLGVVFKYHPFGMGIAENSTENNLKIYPNPVSSSAILQTDKYLKDATLTVYNLFWQEVKQIKNVSGQTITLYRDNLPSGLYFIRLSQDNKILSSDKFIVTDN